MITPSPGVDGDVNVAAPDFVYAVSLLAALEGTTGEAGHRQALPFLGMARAERVAFGQRRPASYVEVEIHDFHAGLAELEERLTAMLTSSEVLEHTLRVDAARRFLRRASPPPPDDLPGSHPAPTCRAAWCPIRLGRCCLSPA